MTKYQKRIRLKQFNYSGYYKYSVTICAEKKKEIFICDEVIMPCIEILKEVSEKYLFNIWAYCFMPNHLHILSEGKDQNSNFRKFISVFKQKTSFNFKNNNIKKIYNYYDVTRLWQENYYERVLRKEDDTIEVTKYILNNPVRKGLIENYYDYPYSGSFMIDIKEL